MRTVLRQSPNRSQRVHGDSAVRLIVCHTPEGSYESALATCLNPNADVSYHLLIATDGSEATQLVPFSEKAWHAGALNSLSDGISVAGFARHFDLKQGGVKEMARVVARRLHARGLKPQWTTDVAKGGFCRHGDLQADRSDPTPDIAEWKLFVTMVQDEYDNQAKPVPSRSWPIPLPKWFWKWMLWKDKGGPRPNVPRLIPAWAWRRRLSLLKNRK